ncbi:MAG: hypothetical protein M1482_09180 [Chloroflexi bacterium]|nr:hypothetical protein [Chloroflexota bacterium]
MKRVLLVALASFAAIIAITGCTAAPAPTLAAQPSSTIPPIAPAPTTAAPQPTAAAAQPTAGAQPTAAATQPTAAAQPTAAPQPTNAAPTAAPAATGATEPTSATSVPTPTSGASSPTAPPGLYVTSVRLDPEQPTHGQSISFYVSFLNTATSVQNVKWQVYIYRADNPTRRNNETTVVQTAFNPGPIELQAVGTFRYGSTGNACDFFFARVDQLDINNKGIDLTKPDGQVFEKGFSICE